MQRRPADWVESRRVTLSRACVCAIARQGALFIRASGRIVHSRDNDVARMVLAAVTGLAHNLGISVCAEGVEDEETFEFLKKIECDKMQGFLICEAVMPDIIRRVYISKGRAVEAVA